MTVTTTGSLATVWVVRTAVAGRWPPAATTTTVAGRAALGRADRRDASRRLSLTTVDPRLVDGGLRRDRLPGGAGRRSQPRLASPSWAAAW